MLYSWSTGPGVWMLGSQSWIWLTRETWATYVGSWCLRYLAQKIRRIMGLWRQSNETEHYTDLAWGGCSSYCWDSAASEQEDPRYMKIHDRDYPHRTRNFYLNITSPFLCPPTTHTCICRCLCTFFPIDSHYLQILCLQIHLPAKIYEWPSPNSTHGVLWQSFGHVWTGTQKHLYFQLK